MKKLLLIISFLLVSVFSFSQVNDNNGKSMRPILTDMDQVITAVEDKGFEIVKIEYDIVKKDAEKLSYRVLTNAYTYRVYVLGDYRSEDMDLEVYKQKADGTYELVGKDTKTEKYAMYDIAPSENAWYKFVVKCYKFAPMYSGSSETWTGCHYGLMVFHN